MGTLLLVTSPPVAGSRLERHSAPFFLLRPPQRHRLAAIGQTGPAHLQGLAGARYRLIVNRGQRSYRCDYGQLTTSVQLVDI